MCHFIHKFPCKERGLEAGLRSVKAFSGETQGIYYPHAVYSVLSSCCCTCVNHSLPVKSLTSVTGSQGNWIPAQTKRSFT